MDDIILTILLIISFLDKTFHSIDLIPFCILVKSSLILLWSEYLTDNPFRIGSVLKIFITLFSPAHSYTFSNKILCIRKISLTLTISISDFNYLIIPKLTIVVS